MLCVFAVVSRFFSNASWNRTIVGRDSQLVSFDYSNSLHGLSVLVEMIVRQPLDLFASGTVSLKPGAVWLPCTLQKDKRNI